MDTIINRKRIFVVRDLSTGGLMIALFAISSNIIPPIYVIPNIPITLQTLTVIMMGALLGVRNGLFCILTLFVATLCGLPFMSGFKGGPAVFTGATGGFIFGFALIVLVMGIYRDLMLPRIIQGRYTKVIHFPLFILFGFVAILLDYACGTFRVCLLKESGLAAFWSTYLGMMTFLPADIIKTVAAAFLSFPLYITFFKPNRASHHLS